MGKVETEAAIMQTLPTKGAVKEPERGQAAGVKGAIGIISIVGDSRQAQLG